SLSWKAILTNTLSCKKNVSGNKSRKDRFTMGLCANATGTNKITTSLMQPIDQRIIGPYMLRAVLTCQGGINEFYQNYNIKDCLEILMQAWAEITTENLKNDWNKIIAAPSDTTNLDEDEHLEELISTLISEGQISPEEATAFLSSCTVCKKSHDHGFRG
ncbi:hypothetical protein WH47_05034, partial [Habropoda laboriosa]